MYTCMQLYTANNTPYIRQLTIGKIEPQLFGMLKDVQIEGRLWKFYGAQLQIGVVMWYGTDMCMCTCKVAQD